MPPLSATSLQHSSLHSVYETEDKSEEYGAQESATEDVDFADITRHWEMAIKLLFTTLDEWESIALERMQHRRDYKKILKDAFEIADPLLTDPTAAGAIRSLVTACFKYLDVLMLSREEMEEQNYLYYLKRDIWKLIGAIEDIALEFPDDAPYFFGQRGINLEKYRDFFHVDRKLLMNYRVIPQYW